MQILLEWASNLLYVKNIYSILSITFYVFRICKWQEIYIMFAYKSMMTIVIDSLVSRFGINPWIIASWWEIFQFDNEAIAIEFFSKKENIAFINAQPFVVN